MRQKNIDNGRQYDFGLTSENYAKYRDIYPQAFYNKILDLGLCQNGQEVLDIGTGTGVLPRALYAYGAHFTGIDISENQIEQAKELAAAQNMNITFECAPAEEIPFQPHTFDVITACQCFHYFDHETLAPKLNQLLKKGGKLAVLYMAWLPFEDEIAGKTEELVLKFNPDWTGCGETRRHTPIPAIYERYFSLEAQELFDISIPFTRESWHGRMLTCRGVGASLSPAETRRFEKEHMAFLNNQAPEKFDILHYAAVAVLKAK